MHNSFYWRRNLGTGTGGTPDLAVCAITVTAADTPVSLTPSDEVYTFTMSDNLVSVSVVSAPINIDATDDPLSAAPNC